jgi:hypothetical protein
MKGDGVRRLLFFDRFSAVLASVASPKFAA